MKTAMQMALARIELLYGMKPDAIHWEMFKNDCMEKEREQMLGEWKKGFEDAKYIYNQTYNL